MTVAFRRIELTRSLSAELVTSQSLDNPAIIAAPAPVAIEPPMLADGWLRQCLRMVYPGPLWRLVRPLALRGRHFLQREIEPQLEGLRLQQVQAGETLRRLERLLESGALQSPDGPARGHPPAIGLRRKVHQFHAGSATGDAITNAMLLIQRQLRAMGFASEIFVEHVGLGLEDRVQPLDALPRHDDHVLLVHHSIGHDGFNRVMASPAPKVLIYHNITPPELLSHSPSLQRAVELGRRQLVQLRHQVVAALADSVFNGIELRRLGFGCVLEATLLFDIDALLRTAQSHALRRLAAPFTVLFVGRMVPSKGQADLVDAFAVFARRWFALSGRRARLVLAGVRSPGSDPYQTEIETRIDAQGVAGQVLMTGKLSDSDLHDWFGAADLYVSLSQHEGFGVPLVEAMAHGVPVVALRAGAVAHTLGEGGVLLHSADPETVASAMLTIARDPRHAGEIAGRQLRTLDSWALSHHLPVLRHALAMAGASPPEVTGTRAAVVAGMQIEFPGRPPAGAAAMTVRLLQRGLAEAGLGGAGGGGPLVAIELECDEALSPGPVDVRLALVGCTASLVSLSRARRMNQALHGVLVPTERVARALVESGVAVPIRVVGIGPDLARYSRLRQALRPAPTEARGFLHVVQGSADGELAILLAAWTRAFQAGDNVRLCVLTTPGQAGETARLLANERAAGAVMAEIDLLVAEICEETLLSVLAAADVVVLPDATNGFGSLVAEAMAAGRHLIVAAHGPQMDLCNDDGAAVRIVRHRHRPVSANQGAAHGMLAEPELDDLVSALREAAFRRLPDQPVLAMPALDALTPRRWAERVAAAAADIVMTPPAQPLRIGWVTPWGVRCGVAEYSRQLLSSLNRDHAETNAVTVVLCDRRPSVAEAFAGLRVRPCFGIGDAAAAGDLAQAIGAEDPDVLVIQHHPGILWWPALADLLERPAVSQRCAVVVLHNTRDLAKLDPVLRERLGAGLAGISRVLVHTPADLAELSAFGVGNAVWMPQGCAAAAPSPSGVTRSFGTAPRIGATGFLLPPKGFQRLLRAVALLLREWPDLRVRLVTAIYPDPKSAAERAQCEALVTELGLERHVEWHTGFEPAARVMELLAPCDVLVLPYAATTESSSAAARQAISSSVPTLVSDQPVFDDLGNAVARLPSTEPEAIAAEVAALLRNADQRAQLQQAAQRWITAHDWSVIAERIQGMLAGLHQEHRTRQRANAQG